MSDFLDRVLPGTLVAFTVATTFLSAFAHLISGHVLPVQPADLLIACYGCIAYASITINRAEIRELVRQTENPTRATFFFSDLTGPAAAIEREEVAESMWRAPQPHEIELAKLQMPGRATGHIIGWRAWAGFCEEHEDAPYVPPSYRLRSLTMRHVQWKPREPMIGSYRASYHHDDDAQVSAGVAGIYALKERECVTMMGEIAGQVALWGDVIEHEDGYRARYAYPVSLIAQRLMLPPEAQGLADAYGIPVTVPFICQKDWAGARAWTTPYAQIHQEVGDHRRVAGFTDDDWEREIKKREKVYLPKEPIGPLL